VSVEHSDHEVIGGAQRSVQQLVFTAAQLVEVIARMRAAADQRREADARAAAATDRDTADRVRARQDSDRRAEQAARAGARQQWAPANDQQWRHDAPPEDLLTAWAAATTWASTDQQAAAAMLRTEDEIRDRWPTVADRYDRLRADDGLHPAAAMTIALTDAANAGWDPVTNPAATPRPPASTRAALPGAADDGQAVSAPGDPTDPAVDAQALGSAVADHQASRDRGFDRGPAAAELALRWHAGRRYQRHAGDTSSRHGRASAGPAARPHPLSSPG